MVRSLALLCLATALAAQPTAQNPSPPDDQRPTLEQLAKIARQRAEKQRPKQLAALEPFLSDLALDYSANEVHLRDRLAKVAELGDGIVPLLLENLKPKDEGDAVARNIAANSARVLAQLEPASFADELLQLARGDSSSARGHALSLLGRTESRAAATFLVAHLDEAKGQELLKTIEALTELKARDAAPKIASLLKSEDARVRVAASAFLATNPHPAALDAVVGAIVSERGADVVLACVRYLQQAASRNGAAADALAPLLRDDRLDRQRLVEVVRSLAGIAPEGHQPTLDACKRILDEEQDTGELGRACMLTMRDLGDKSGIRILFDNLRDRIKRLKDFDNYMRRGEAYIDLEEWSRAARDFEEAIKEARSSSVRQTLYRRLALCEASRERWSNLVKAWKDGRVGRDAIMQDAEQYEAVRKALDQRRVQTHLESLPK